MKCTVYVQAHKKIEGKETIPLTVIVIRGGEITWYQHFAYSEKNAEFDYDDVVFHEMKWAIGLYFTPSGSELGSKVRGASNWLEMFRVLREAGIQAEEAIVHHDCFKIVEDGATVMKARAVHLTLPY